MSQQLLRQARTFASAFKDPRRPGCCAICLVSFAERLKDDKNAVSELRSQCHEFWKACLVMLSTNRPELDIAELQKTMFYVDTRCKHDDRHTGGPAPGSRYSPFNLLIDALYRCIIAGLTGGDRSMIGRVLQLNKGFNNKRGLWPATSEDLFPLEKKASIDTHVRWCCRFVAPSAFTGLSAFLAITRPLSAPHLFEEPTRGLLVWAIVQMLSVDCERLVEDYRGVCNCQLSGEWERPDWMRAGPQNESIVAACILLAVISDGPDSAADDMARFTLHDEPALFPAVQLALGHVPRGSAYHATLCTYAVSLHDRLVGRLTGPAAQLAPAVREFRASQPDLDNPIDVFHMYVMRRAARRGCAAQKCGKHMHDSETGKAFPLCAKCKTVRYCGRECQRRDWTDPSITHHKEICPLLCRISAAAGGEEVAKLSLPEFRAAFKKAGFDETEEFTIFTWTTHSAILPLLLSSRMLELLQQVINASTVVGTPVRPSNFKVPDIGTEGQLANRIKANNRLKSKS